MVSYPVKSKVVYNEDNVHCLFVHTHFNIWRNVKICMYVLWSDQ